MSTWVPDESNENEWEPEADEEEEESFEHLDLDLASEQAFERWADVALFDPIIDPAQLLTHTAFPLEGYLVSAYEQIDDRLQRAGRAQHFGDRLVAAMERALAAQQACETLRRLITDEEFKRRLKAAEQQAHGHGPNIVRTVQSRALFEQFKQAEEQVLFKAGLNRKKARDLVAASRAAFDPNRPDFTAAEVTASMVALRNATCLASADLLSNYHKLKKQRGHKWMKKFVGGSLLVAVNAVPSLASAGSLTPVGIGLSVALGGAFMQQGLADRQSAPEPRY